MSWFSNLLHKWTLKKAYKWGRGLAKTKLRVFYTLRERNLDLPLEDIYYLTILNRIGYTEATADMIIKGRSLYLCEVLSIGSSFMRQ